ncbi:hypothetical protein HPP92_012586 [Vanilla planifolia]|uniref:Uncharacterized protein n=1 Tax=Vanilla planifolia TaxID=51239 RepID=A0A835R1U6_VANPL|nr:hypothetical protein HPP92_012586 [Vanilla planifolia]
MALRVIQEIQVSPSPPLPSQPSHVLSFLDFIWLFSSPVERLFFYDFPHPTSHFMDRHLPAFTRSLSLALRHFYPLSGTIRRSPASEDRVEIAYSDGDSVSVTIAEFNGDDFRNLSGHNPRHFKILRMLVPKIPISADGEITPLAVQVTLFPNQGLCVAFAVHHAACDGTGSMQFIKAWARGAIDESEAPLLDRSLVRDTRGLQQKLFKVLPGCADLLKERQQKQSTAPPELSRLVAATFVLSGKEIGLLKKRVEERAAGSLHCSAFVVTSAYVWACLVKSRGECGDTVVFFGFVVDWRSRMVPALPKNYFGNCLGSSILEMKAGELVAAGGVEVAAVEIGRRIDGLHALDVGEGLEMAINSYEKLTRSRGLSVAGSPKLRVYETDFGWGRPTKVQLTSIMETGAMSLAESREDDGGLEIGMVLSIEEMDAFRAEFETGRINLCEIFNKT